MPCDARLTIASGYGIIVIIYLIMNIFMRTIADIPPSQLQQLEAICRREDLSRAEAVRLRQLVELADSSLGYSQS